MTWRFGFFRLWLVFTVLWLAGWGPGLYFLGASRHCPYETVEKLTPEQSALEQKRALANARTRIRIKDLSSALKNADKAGDTAAARAFADEIYRLRGSMLLSDADVGIVPPCPWRELLNNMKSPSAAVVLPPLGLLALGWLVTWGGHQNDSGVVLYRREMLSPMRAADKEMACHSVGSRQASCTRSSHPKVPDHPIPS